jgi:hypothetical protein
MKRAIAMTSSAPAGATFVHAEHHTPELLDENGFTFTPTAREEPPPAREVTKTSALRQPFGDGTLFGHAGELRTHCGLAEGPFDEFPLISETPPGVPTSRSRCIPIGRPGRIPLRHFIT